jgi:hypothetical protein
MKSFLRKVNPVAPEGIEELYIREGAIEGIRGDVAFAQALKETNYFRFGGQAKIEWHNPAGMGVTGEKDSAGQYIGNKFPSWQIGIQAHVQHLFAYANKTGLPKQKLVDKRFNLVPRGSAPNWEDLNGKWAVPGLTYGQDIIAIWQEMLSINVKKNLVLAYSQQYKNKCVLGDTEHDHMKRIAGEVYNILERDVRFNLFFMPEINLGDDAKNLTESINKSNNFINANGGTGFHLELHSDAGAYAKGCSGLYYSQAGKEFITPIFNEMADLTPWNDAGLKYRDNLSALKKTKAVSGILEVSFHDNLEEAYFIHKSYIPVAVRIVNGLYKYFTNKI